MPASILVSLKIQPMRREMETLNLYVGPAHWRTLLRDEFNTLIVDHQGSTGLRHEVLQPGRRLPGRGSSRGALLILRHGTHGQKSAGNSVKQHCEQCEQ